MRKQAGFTLIELVIVIIILGILAVTAAPKFLNLQSDARKAAADGVKASLQSASQLVYSKAALKGIESTAAGSSIGVSGADGTTILTNYGYPTNASISAAVTLDGWAVSGSGGTFVPSNQSNNTCSVTYDNALTSAGGSPSITVDDSCDD
ncbi:MSHA pilin protein MshA [Aeromonas sp. RU39B]|uniref:prepilin-type N-terminal cleavage/methylation domain-containing protein n=1 Tax=Aeromonas sp. RU39B TaxID=1907416 RepID=UPI000955BFE9|nr:prepilin-type N-terminal cleavage/methylation domain-containing protein [Aeromonas sp. RU39B]SIR54949.1 MSHA pilin protein MshA [Aeromonas sp. RU39B]